MFTVIKGTQHDHGIHSFTFGPDGRLYFNFGNSGEELHTPDGKIVVDLAGNEVRAARKPYQEGMAFRCELDGSRVETLGWNFRNNWELCVDSFGSVWQSDNDDDGNRGVRINFVMEYGNYGYKDEFTGAGWQASRDGSSSSLGGGHAHSGCMIYEGTDWPAAFRGRLFTLNFHGRRMNQEILERAGSGYVARHGEDLFQSGDTFFRGIDLASGPDGSVFVLDWSDTGECHERDGVHRRSGRIFRIAFRGPDAVSKPAGPIDLDALDDASLARLERHPDGWWADHARQATYFL
jgi:putative membrane-bound dehydrogenase-like protein